MYAWVILLKISAYCKLMGVLFKTGFIIALIRFAIRETGRMARKPRMSVFQSVIGLPNMSEIRILASVAIKLAAVRPHGKRALVTTASNFPAATRIME